MEKLQWPTVKHVSFTGRLEGRGRLFPEKNDAADPWQFTNFRVI